ncbi:hypothetical protein A9Q86_15015 [Flavobacteriales bacterium 33_180_T64]|nr:hypothetical protein A9Q86_15015 [Flavobacteriales bacterium 33_180_T64]
MKYGIVLLALVLFMSCKNEKNNVHEFNVEYKGALKLIMRKGDVSAKTELINFENKEHFYAIGALENLKGEIQIFDSKPFNTIVVDSALSFDNSFNKKAALLVYATVNKWKSFDIPGHVLTYSQLEIYVNQVAQENQIKIDKPFPFLIEGVAKSFNWHVINWKDGDLIHSHEKHVNSGLNGVANFKEVEMLGFYSDAHHTIFTHHTTNMHIHLKTVDGKIAGHVDDLILGKGMILKLPEVN